MNEEWIFIGEFAALVFNYLRMEWGVELRQFPAEQRDWALALVADLKGRESVPDIAAKVADGLPL